MTISVMSVYAMSNQIRANQNLHWGYIVLLQSFIHTRPVAITPCLPPFSIGPCDYKPVEEAHRMPMRSEMQELSKQLN